MLIVWILLSTGIIWWESPSNKEYPIRGIDVSHYQGNIDWFMIEDQKIDFAYIKATEGSSSVDAKFIENWEEANLTNMRIGAYHFFSFESQGKTQAENFIGMVPKEKNALPPAVDIEFYGDKWDNPPEVDVVRKELDSFLDEIEAYYECKPVIYATKKAYDMYIDKYYDSYPLWIRSVYHKPFIFKSRKWTFWQYTDSALLKGYDGDEKCIDMNIFNGTLEEFEKMFP